MKLQRRGYLREIGSRGGRKSRRQLDPLTARRMVALREARKAFQRYKTQCFWSYRPDWQISIEDVPLVTQQLQSAGDRAAFERARRIARLWSAG